MASSGAEKRRDPRIYFADGALLSAKVQFNHGTNSLGGEVMNLSAGGLQFSFERQGNKPIMEGDKLTLQAVGGLVELEGLAGIAMEVRWIIDHEFLKHVAVGCEFIGLADEQRNSLAKVVDARLAQQQ